jgi:hypothetical protein
MYFVSNRPGSLGSPGSNGGRDIWVSWRPKVHDDAGWTEPFPAQTINSGVADAGPSYFENEEGGFPQLFFASSRAGSFDIFSADVYGGASFGPPRRVDEVNTAEFTEARPFIRHDGLELFFFRGLGIVNDIYVATRTDPGALWSVPVSIGAPVNTVFNEQQPALSSDGQTLFFTSNRPGSFAGSLDVWASIRIKESGR